MYDGRTGEGARCTEEDGEREKALLCEDEVLGGDFGNAAPWERTCRPVMPCFESEKKNVAIRFINPMMEVRIPEAITMRQKGRPRAAWEVAGLLRFPRMLKPRVIIERPRKTKPLDGERRGQVLRK